MSNFRVMSPATGQQVGEVNDAGPDEARRCLDVADDAFQSWRASTAYERAAILRRWNDLVIAHANELARIITKEMGKPVSEARGEVRYTASFIEWYAEEAKRVRRDAAQPDCR
jgi:succinate-semialdehyde dehydrogenase/glutarate-semialdehyde dehydrogenase